MTRWVLIPGLLLLGGCTGLALDGRETKPQLHSETECMQAVNTSQCRIENALAGGAPMNFAQD